MWIRTTPVLSIGNRQGTTDVKERIKGTTLESSLSEWRYMDTGKGFDERGFRATEEAGDRRRRAIDFDVATLLGYYKGVDNRTA